MSGNLMELKGSKALVIGMGKSGEAAGEALVSLGATVYPYDDNKPGFYNRETLPGLSWDIAVVSPGVPLDIPIIASMREGGTEIIGELELAYRIGKGRFIAITGTNGKTTTTALTGNIFSELGEDSVTAGNIGNPVVTEALKARETTWLITEVSSFQLETIAFFKPVASAILNLTPDHLDRHGDMKGYGAAKARIFENQGPDDSLVYNFDDPLVRALASDCKASLFPFSRKEGLEKGVYLRNGRIILADPEYGYNHMDLMGADEIPIPGAHNLENTLAAAAIAYSAGLAPERIPAGIRSFPGVAHRLEAVAEIGGVKYINDSKGTNPDASIKAVEAMDPGIILIAGGYDKQADYRDWIRAFGGKVKKLILMGKTAPAIRAVAEAEGFSALTLCENMKECVDLASRIAEPGDTVLLSPACASWDMYKRFEDRGDDFKACVEGLREKP